MADAVAHDAEALAQQVSDGQPVDIGVLARIVTHVRGTPDLACVLAERLGLLRHLDVSSEQFQVRQP